MVIVGEGPSPRFYDAPIVHPLYGGPAQRLATVAGWCPPRATPTEAYRQLLRRARLFNLCSGPWAYAEARARAESLTTAIPDGVFVLLGRRVAAAFGHRHAWYSVVTDGVRATVVVPHPSGLNRVWNSRVTLEQTGQSLQRAYQISLHDWS